MLTWTTIARLTFACTGEEMTAEAAKGSLVEQLRRQLQQTSLGSSLVKTLWGRQTA